MNCDLVRGRTEISSSDMEGRGGEKGVDHRKGEKGNKGTEGVAEGGIITGISHVPHLRHLMNKQSADLIERHSNRLLLSSWQEEGREKERTLAWSR